MDDYYDYGGDSYLDDWDTQYLQNQDYGSGLDLSGLPELPDYGSDIFDLPGTSYELALAPDFQSPQDWGNLFDLGSYSYQPTSMDFGSLSPYSWSDIQEPDLTMASDLGYDFTSAPNIVKP